MATREERSFNFAIFRRVRDNDVDFFGGGGFFLKKGKGVFLSGLPPSPRGGGGAIHRAYDSGQSHHALRACLIRGSAGNESELFGIMTTIPNLKKD